MLIEYNQFLRLLWSRPVAPTLLKFSLLPDSFLFRSLAVSMLSNSSRNPNLLSCVSLDTLGVFLPCLVYLFSICTASYPAWSFSLSSVGVQTPSSIKIELNLEFPKNYDNLEVLEESCLAWTIRPVYHASSEFSYVACSSRQSDASLWPFLQCTKHSSAPHLTAAPPVTPLHSINPTVADAGQPGQHSASRNDGQPSVAAVSTTLAAYTSSYLQHPPAQHPLPGAPSMRCLSWISADRTTACYGGGTVRVGRHWRPQPTGQPYAWLIGDRIPIT